MWKKNTNNSQKVLSVVKRMYYFVIHKYILNEFNTNITIRSCSNWWLCWFATCLLFNFGERLHCLFSLVLSGIFFLELQNLGFHFFWRKSTHTSASFLLWNKVQTWSVCLKSDFNINFSANVKVLRLWLIRKCKFLLHHEVDVKVWNPVQEGMAWVCFKFILVSGVMKACISCWEYRKWWKFWDTGPRWSGMNHVYLQVLWVKDKERVKI